MKTRDITPARADEAFADFQSLAIERHPHGLLLHRILTLRSVFSAYDGAYIALAEALATPLLTCDEKLRSHGHAAQIELTASRPRDIKISKPDAASALN